MLQPTSSQGGGDARVLTMQIHQECHRLRQKLRRVQSGGSCVSEISARGSCASTVSTTSSRRTSSCGSIGSASPPMRSPSMIVMPANLSMDRPSTCPTFRPPSRTSSSSSGRRRRRPPRPVSPSSIVRRISDLCEAELERKAERIRLAAAITAESCADIDLSSEDDEGEGLAQRPRTNESPSTQYFPPSNVSASVVHGDHSLEADLELRDVTQDVDATLALSGAPGASPQRLSVPLPVRSITFDTLYKYASDDDKIHSQEDTSDEDINQSSDECSASTKCGDFSDEASDIKSIDDLVLEQSDSELNMDEFMDANQSMREFSSTRGGDEAFPIQPALEPFTEAAQPNAQDQNSLAPAEEVIVKEIFTPLEKAPLMEKAPLIESVDNPQDLMANPQDIMENPQDPSVVVLVAAPPVQVPKEQHPIPSKPDLILSSSSDDASVAGVSVASTKSKTRRRRFIRLRKPRQERPTASLNPSRPSFSSSFFSSWGNGGQRRPKLTLARGGKQKPLGSYF